MKKVKVHIAIAVHGYGTLASGVKIGKRTDKQGRVSMPQHAGLALAGEVARFGKVDGAVSIEIPDGAAKPTGKATRSALLARVRKALGGEWDLAADGIPLPPGHRYHPGHGWVSSQALASTDFFYAYPLRKDGSRFGKKLDVMSANGKSRQSLSVDFLVVAQSQPMV